MWGVVFTACVVFLFIRMNILLAFAHNIARWSSHLNMKIAQIA
jgi:hypothetical protein